MLADISQFESLGKTNGQSCGVNSVFNNLPVLFDQYKSVQDAYNKGNEFLKNIISSDTKATETLAHSITDAMDKYSTDLFQLKEKIIKEADNNGITREDRVAYMQLSNKIKSDFQNLFATDPILVRTGEIAEGIPAATFNGDNDKLVEFDSLKREFIQTVTSELMERIDMLEESAGQEYRNIAGSALNRAVESLNGLMLEKSEVPKLEAVLKQFSDTISAAEVATARPKLDLIKTKQVAEGLKRRLKT